jgi:hypothetical protein
MRSQLRFELARSVAAASLMPSPNATPLFPLPKLQRALPNRQSRSGAGDRRSRNSMQCCSRPLVAREGQFVLKYFLLRKAIPGSRKRGSKRPRPRLLRQKRLNNPAGDIGGRRCCPLRAACGVFGSHHKAVRTRVATARCAPPRHRCRKSNQVPTMADHRWPVRMPIR